jgi:hypothetical protein
MIVNYMAPYPKDKRYWVTSEGAVWSTVSRKWLKPQACTSGRLQIRPGKALVYVHRMVLLTFRGEPPQGYVGCHNNGFFTDNTLDNLRWDTQSENRSDDKWNGRGKPGKLTPQQVLEVRRRRKAGEPCRDIASDYGVHERYVPLVVSGARHRNVIETVEGPVRG